MSLPKAFDNLLVRALRVAGYALMRREHLSLSSDRRARMLAARGIDLVIDVGANTGQYGHAMRKLGYGGRIASFEPMRGAYGALSRAAELDGKWQTYAFALGDEDSLHEIHISQNSVSSSLLPMLSEHEKFAPRSRYISSERIEVRRLDGIFRDVRQDAQHVWLKIDVQGFEDRVLRGAVASLNDIEFIQIELSLRPLYEGQKTYRDVAAQIEKHGFTLVGVEPGFLDAGTGEMLQMDGIFRRT
jgi:FkbM family methyltransferase